MTLGRTCRELLAVAQKQWDINQALGSLVQRQLELRSLLGKHQSLISGSFALHFFLRNRSFDDGFDIYVENGDVFDELSDYIHGQRVTSTSQQRRRLHSAQVFSRYAPYYTL
jgi:hypothetical protein